MKHILFDILFSAGCMLLAVRLGKFFEAQDSDLGNIPVNFFLVNSNLQLRTANDTQLLTQIPHICSISILRKGLRRKDGRSGKLCQLYICVYLISNSWDTETNPGQESRSDSHFPCGLCDVSVGWEDRGICCDTCNVWYHIDCQGMSPTMYSIYNRSLGKSMAWECMRCCMPNFSTSLFDTTASLEVSNRFDTLSSLSEPDSPVPDNIGPPKAASSPIVQQSKEARPKTKKAVLNHPLRILIMNCQSVKNKKAEIHTIINSAKPDIILGNESWLTPDIKKTRKFFQTLLMPSGKTE